MKGSGRAFGAISFVNALSTGIGSAGAVSLSVSAEVESGPAKGPTPVYDVPSDSDTPLVRRALEEAARQTGPAGAFDLTLRLEGDLPIGKGLKSSSAVAVAIARATARSFGRTISSAAAARFSAEIGRSVGVSATGAFDDASASASGGLVVVDTSTMRLLRHDAADPAWSVVLWVPPGRHPLAPQWLEPFRDRAVEARGAVLAARSGRYLVAMERNTELVERVTGLDYRAARRSARSAGALASGISGLGPALAAIVRSERRERVVQAWSGLEGECRALELIPPRSEAP